jgi:hypothetical protein
MTPLDDALLEEGVIQDAICAHEFPFEGQTIGLAGTDEAVAGEAVLRLLGHEARLVIGGGRWSLGGLFHVARLALLPCM